MKWQSLARSLAYPILSIVLILQAASPLGARRVIAAGTAAGTT